jgi:hypothetical protein
MKAEINEKGTLVISAETPMESYALSRWWENYDLDPELASEQDKRWASSLCVVTSVMEEPA